MGQTPTHDHWGASTPDIDILARKILDVDEGMKAADQQNNEEFTFVAPDVGAVAHTCPLCGNKNQQVDSSSSSVQAA
eukprot:9270-Heterococcus_DN1.PRE.1